jgi:glycosyltransferase involved in cell wall biosynthesis
VPSRAILVPTAERDAAVGLQMFHPVFRGVRALMYNSHEERAMIQAVSGNEHVPGIVVGVGSDVPQNPQAARFRQKYNIRGPFAIYVGRIDENKGCADLFRFFERYLSEDGGALSLVLVGNSLLPIPTHPRIRHLGFVDDADKFDAMAAAELLIMPSYFESLSMVALEAWALGRPVLVNGRCEVLKAQSIRSNAGLYYETEAEFVEALRALERNRWLAEAYRSAALPDRPRSALGMLQDVPPAEMEAMLLADAKIDDDALRQLANQRAQAVKDAIVATGVQSDRLFLIAPRLGNEAGGVNGADGETPGTPARVDLALR